MREIHLITDAITGEHTITDDLEAYIAKHVAQAAEAGDPEQYKGLSAADPQSCEHLLGITWDDSPDPDDMDDRLWAQWIAAHLSAHGYWTDGRAVIRPGRDFGPITADSWPGGSIQVRPVHGDVEQSWRHTESWAQLREWAEVAHDEDDEGLADIARQRAAEDARWEPLRAAQRALEHAEREAVRLRAERDQLVRIHIDTGDTKYLVAQKLGIAQPTVDRAYKRS